VQAMYLRLALPEPEAPAGDRPPFLVYGGSTSVGKYAIQLGRLSGCRVIATASPRNHEDLRRLGADEVLDYHDEAWPEAVYELTGGTLRHALDCVSEHGSTGKAARSMAREGGDICRLLPIGRDVRDELAAANPAVRAQSTVVYTVFGRAFTYRGFDNCGAETPADKALWEKYLGLLTRFLAEGLLEPNKVKKMGTLDDVLEGFKLSMENKVSAEKLVYSISS
jgi:NADPH:quinone reductase-like Zn-dependent oxidoreductase